MSSRSRKLVNLAIKPISVVSSDENADISINQVINVLNNEPREVINIDICSVQGNYYNFKNNIYTK